MPVDRRLTKPVARDVAEQLRESFESGTYTSANGSTYTGTIDRDYQRMGCGEERYSVGGAFTGQFEGNLRHGEGEMHYACVRRPLRAARNIRTDGCAPTVARAPLFSRRTGAHYRGEWRSDLQHGKGTYVFDNGESGGG